MELRKITDRCFYFHAAVNIGYIHNGASGMLIDAGLDSQAIKKVLRQLEEQSLPLTHLFITHSHSDHYGGAAYLQSKKEIFTIAPKLEEAILQNPVLMPMYLFQGNSPLKEMRNKFMEGPPVKVDCIIDEGKKEIDGFQLEFISFPGHAENQTGLLYEGVLYCGDAYFGLEQLNKHKIPYITDASLAVQSLEKLKSVQAAGAVPGHGVYEENFQNTVEGNIVYHSHLLDYMQNILRSKPEGCSQEDLVEEMCRGWEAGKLNLSSWLLYRTAVTAYAAMLVKEGRAEVSIQNYRLWFRGA